METQHRRPTSTLCMRKMRILLCFAAVCTLYARKRCTIILMETSCILRARCVYVQSSWTLACNVSGPSHRHLSVLPTARIATTVQHPCSECIFQQRHTHTHTFIDLSPIESSSTFFAVSEGNRTENRVHVVRVSACVRAYVRTRCTGIW